METSRRQFLKLAGALAGATALPVTLGTVIELEAVFDEQLVRDAITIEPSPDRRGILATVDQAKMWQAVHLVDQYGHQWCTQDQGQTWSWNGHSFTAEGLCTSAS